MKNERSLSETFIFHLSSFIFHLSSFMIFHLSSFINISHDLSSFFSICCPS